MSDIALDHFGDIIIENKEDFQIISNIPEKIQQIKNRILTPIGNLFYDDNFGSEIINFIQMDLSYEKYIQLKESINITLNKESIIDKQSINIDIYHQQIDELIIKIEFKIVGETESSNIDIILDKNGIRIYQENNYAK